jgi:hypothetical protein
MSFQTVFTSSSWFLPFLVRYPLASKGDHTPVPSVLDGSNGAPCSQVRHVPYNLPSWGRFMSVMWIVGRGVMPSHTFLPRGGTGVWENSSFPVRCLGPLMWSFYSHLRWSVHEARSVFYTCLCLHTPGGATGSVTYLLKHPRPHGR